LDFIAPRGIKDEIIEKLVGRQININKIDKFEFLLKYRIVIEIKNKRKKRTYKINCPKPSAFLYHKGATFIDREDEQKQAKDLYYMYFILRYAPRHYPYETEKVCWRYNLVPLCRLHYPFSKTYSLP